MKKWLGLAFGFLLLLPFCNTVVKAVTNGTNTQRFTSPASTPIVVYGLVGAYRCSFIFGGGTTGPIDVQGGYNGSFSNITVTDISGGSHTSPFTPSMNSQYYFGVTAYDTAQIVPDATWSGQDATGTLACTPAAVAQATAAPVNIINMPGSTPGAIIQNTPAVVVFNTPGVNVENTPGFICISGCAGGGATIPPELSTTAPLPVVTSLPAIGQNYWWNGAGWIAQSLTSPAPVTTPAPCATPNCNQVDWQGTNPWVVGQGLGTNLHMVFDNPSPIPGLTPIPFPTGTTNPVSVAAFTSSTGTTVMPAGCNSAPIPINISTATTTLLGANAAGMKWHVCFISIYVVSGTTPGFFFETGGTGTCSGPTAITGTYGGIASAIGELFQFGTGLGQIMQTTGANSSWCIVSNGTLPNLQGFAEAAQY